MNNEDDMLRFLQIWIMPDKRGHNPQYGQRMFSRQDRHNQFVQMLAGNGKLNRGGVAPKSDESIIRLHQDVNVYASECDAGKTVQYQLGAARQAYAVCIEGTERRETKAVLFISRPLVAFLLSLSLSLSVLQLSPPPPWTPVILKVLLLTSIQGA